MRAFDVICLVVAFVYIRGSRRGSIPKTAKELRCSGINSRYSLIWRLKSSGPHVAFGFNIRLRMLKGCTSAKFMCVCDVNDL